MKGSRLSTKAELDRFTRQGQKRVNQFAKSAGIKVKMRGKRLV